MRGFFITGTDTDVGKTVVSVALLKKCAQSHQRTAALKPVASGSEMTAQGLRNQDALALQQAMTMTLPYTTINPVCLPQAIAPHIAAQLNAVELSVEQLLSASQPLLNCGADCIFVEGAGGWLTPINPQQTLADYAAALALPVILVVGMRLGCLNHSLLTVANLQQRGLTLAGWVANVIAPETAYLTENIATLRQAIAAPLLGVIPHLADPLTAVDYLEPLDQLV